jgi:hypothetical protein
VRDPAAGDVEAGAQAGLASERLLRAEVGQREDVRGVALVRAAVEVTGTEPGMFATQ